jgi:potassium-transporting ATPase KdpC subunit
MIKELGAGLRLTLVFTILTGLLYPAFITGLSQLIFPRQANGSLVSVNGKTVGSTFIGQRFVKPEYFHPRPSAAGAGYDATASGGTNLGPTNAKLLEDVRHRVEEYCIENDIPYEASPDGIRVQTPIPSDAVTSSSSGLDPHISPANAALQAVRVAKARHTSADEIRKVIAKNTENADWGFLGEPRVNVLTLNLAIDQRFPIVK